MCYAGCLQEDLYGECTWNRGNQYPCEFVKCKDCNAEILETEAKKLNNKYYCENCFEEVQED